MAMMKTLLAIFTIIALCTTTESCKCGGANGNVAATVACCKNVGGSASGNDCPASQISERLSNFARCCNSLGSKSDCRCPVGC